MVAARAAAGAAQPAADGLPGPFCCCAIFSSSVSAFPVSSGWVSSFASAAHELLQLLLLLLLPWACTEV